MAALQVLLYQLLLEQRYGVPVSQGLLWNLKEPVPAQVSCDSSEQQQQQQAGGCRLLPDDAGAGSGSSAA